MRSPVSWIRIPFSLAGLFLASLILASFCWAPNAAADEPAAEEVPVTKQLQEPLSCPYCDLSGIDLRDRDLTDANLVGADLREADLRGTTLNGTTLVGADLTGARFGGALLKASRRGPTNLSRANLTGASFRGAKLEGVDLQYAIVGGTDFSGVDLTRAVFGPRLRAGIVAGRKTSFRGARLRHEFAVDEALMDVTDVQWQGSPAAVLEEPEIACGDADLSHLTSRVYVASTGTDGTTCGTSWSAPCRSIAKGIERCATAGCGVLVAWDDYNLAATVELRSGIDLYGGCLPEDQASPSYFSAVVGPAGGVPVVKARGLSVDTVVQGFQLNASAASGTDSETSMVLQVENSVGLSVLDSELVAAQGAPGREGASGSSGTAGGMGSGRNGGTVSACSGTAGGLGAVQKKVDTDGSFGGGMKCYKKCDSNNNYCNGYSGQTGSTGYSAPGGNRASGVCTNGCIHDPGPSGGRGENGRAGFCGSRGQAATNVDGALGESGWRPVQGGAGTNGGAGGGGGGGGAGSYWVGYCFWVTSVDFGNSGGGGGAGGCGGSVGSGGMQGGASIGVWVRDSSLDLAGTTVIGGIGGTGGKGGAGASGGAGGGGAAGSTATDAGKGGAGGTGGPGGGSGGSAGGNGGPAIGLAKVGSATVDASSAIFFNGYSGATGAGGAGGEPANSSACDAAQGQAGKSGLVADIHQF